MRFARDVITNLFDSSILPADKTRLHEEQDKLSYVWEYVNLVSLIVMNTMAR